MDSYNIRRTFLDITGGAVAASTHNLYEEADPLTTPNTITTTQTVGEVAREVTRAIIIPPMSAGQVYEDLHEVTFVLDGSPYKHLINLSGVGETLMNPNPQNAIGGIVVDFGVPYWQLCEEGLAGHPRSNMPVLNTTLKYTDKIQLDITTNQAITGAMSGGWRVILVGFQYNQQMLNYLSPGWRNSISLTDGSRKIRSKTPVYTNDFGWSPSLETWSAGPGGRGQGNLKVNPYWHFSYNAIPTNSTAAFPLTNNTNIGGASSSVEDSFKDLGFPFQTNKDAFLLKGFGVRGCRGDVVAPLVGGSPVDKKGNAVGNTPGQNLIRAGWLINGNYIPELSGNWGWFMTQSATSGINPIPFGQARPYRGQDNMFWIIPRVQGEGMLFYQDNAVPWIAGSASIPAYSVCVAMNGVLIEQG